MGVIPNHIAVGGGYRKGRIPPTCICGIHSRPPLWATVIAEIERR